MPLFPERLSPMVVEKLTYLHPLRNERLAPEHQMGNTQ